MVSVVGWLAMARVTYGANVVVLVALMVRVLALAIGRVKYAGQTWQWWRGCCR